MIGTIVQNYNAGNHEAPIVVGHPKDNSPAFGWVDSLEVLPGDRIFAKPKGIQPEFEEAVGRGIYNKRSASFYSNLNLRHIGFLGGMPPALKGLEAVQFNEDEESIEYEEMEFLEFEEASLFNSIGRTFGKMRDLFISKFSIEEADRAIPAFVADDLKNVQPTPIDEPVLPNFTESKKDFPMTPEEIKSMQEENAKLKKANTDFSETVKTLTTEKAVSEKKVTDFEEASAKSEKQAKEKVVSDFCDQAVADGKLKPADKPLVAATLAALDHSEATIEFGEGDSKVSITPFDAYQRQILNSADVVSFNEVAKKDAADESAASFAEGESRFSGTNLDEDSAVEYNEAKKLMSNDASLTFEKALATVRK